MIPTWRCSSRESFVAQVDDLLERRDLVAPVVERVALADVGQPLLRAQRLELREREVVGEPVVREGDAVDHLRGAAVGELRVGGDVGGRADRRLVAHHELVVLRRDEVGLDVVGAHPRGEAVRAERVLGSVAGRAAMAVDRRRVAGVVAAAAGGCDAGGHEQKCGAGEQEPGEPAEGDRHGRHPYPPVRPRWCPRRDRGADASVKRQRQAVVVPAARRNTAPDRRGRAALCAPYDPNAARPLDPRARAAFVHRASPVDELWAPVPA